MRCVVYVRVSDQSQVDGTSLDTQTKMCREYAEREGYKVARVFREEGVSAKTLNRPEFQKLLEYVPNHKIKAVIVYKVDRLSRNLENQLFIIRTLQEAGVGLHSATENVNDTPAGKLQRNILGAFAEYDNQVRGERCRTGAMAMFMQGWWVSTPPPGYDMVRSSATGRSMAVRNEMSTQIQWGFEQRARGWTLAKIADGMNKRGYRSRYGRKIREQNLDRIIKNPFYMGLMVSFDKEVVGRHEPTVSKDLWYRCQAVNEQNAHHSPTRNIINPLFPLRGLVRCSHCGERLTGSAPQGRSKQYEYYHHRSGSLCHLSRNVPKEDMEKDFKNKLAQLKPRPSIFKLVKLVILDYWQDWLKGHQQDQKGITRQLEGLQQEKANLLTEKRRNPNLYDDEDFITQMNELRGKVKALEVLRSDVEDNQDKFEEVLTIAFDALKDPLKSWESLGIGEKVRFEHLLYPQGIEYDGQSCRTAEISLLMHLFEVASAETEK